jgi:hypothetical protein
MFVLPEPKAVQALNQGLHASFTTTECVRAVINRLYCHVQVRNRQDPSAGSFDDSKLAFGGVVSSGSVSVPGAENFRHLI